MIKQYNKIRYLILKLNNICSWGITLAIILGFQKKRVVNHHLTTRFHPTPTDCFCDVCEKHYNYDELTYNIYINALEIYQHITLLKQIN